MGIIQQMDSKQYKVVERRILQDHFDANETAFLQRELEQVRALVLEVEYEELKAKKFFPMASDIATTADTYIYKVLNKSGFARVSAPGADDFPRVELQASERSGRVWQTSVSYGWDWNEMQEAIRLGVGLQTQKAMNAAEAVARLHDQLFATGQDPNLAAAANTALAIPGVLNNANIADGAGAANSRVVAMGTQWVLGTTTGQVINDALSKLATAVPDGSLQTQYADTILLSPAMFNIAASTRMNEFDARTALQAFLAGSPWIKNIDSWNKLTLASASGTKDRTMAYKRAKDVLELVEPLTFMQFPPQAHNAEYVVPAIGRCGGTKVYKPLATVYGDFS